MPKSHFSLKLKLAEKYGAFHLICQYFGWMMICNLKVLLITADFLLWTKLKRMTNKRSSFSGQNSNLIRDIFKELSPRKLPLLLSNFSRKFEIYNNNSNAKIVTQPSSIVIMHQRRP